MTDFSKGFTAGVWYAVEQLVLEYEQPTLAEHIILESGIPEEEFRETLKETGYFENELNDFLDDVFWKIDN